MLISCSMWRVCMSHFGTTYATFRPTMHLIFGRLYITFRPTDIPRLNLHPPHFSVYRHSKIEPHPPFVVMWAYVVGCGKLDLITKGQDRIKNYIQNVTFIVVIRISEQINGKQILLYWAKVRDLDFNSIWNQRPNLHIKKETRLLKIFAKQK